MHKGIRIIQLFTLMYNDINYYSLKTYIYTYKLLYLIRITKYININKCLYIF